MKQTRKTKNTRFLRHNRRGFTLVELSLVLAVLAIISGMIVTFSVLISNQVKRNQLRADFLSAVSACQYDIQTKFAEIDKQDAVIDVSDLNQNITSEVFSYTCDIDGAYLKYTFTIVSNKYNLGDTLTFLLASRCGATFVE